MQCLDLASQAHPEHSGPTLTEPTTATETEPGQGVPAVAEPLGGQPERALHLDQPGRLDVAEEGQGDVQMGRIGEPDVDAGSSRRGNA